MPEFEAELRAEVAQAVAELERLRSSGDEDGERSYENRLVYLRRIAAGNGVNLTDLPDHRVTAEPQPDVAERQTVQCRDGEGNAPGQG